MPGSSGLELAQALAPGGPVVVFVTAFGRYANEAFDVLAVDYVLKPFSDERFAIAVGRAKTRVRERRLAELATQLATVSEELKPAAAAERPAFLSRLSFRQDDHSVIVNVPDVIWIEAEDYAVRRLADAGQPIAPPSGGAGDAAEAWEVGVGRAGLKPRCHVALRPT